MQGSSVRRDAGTNTAPTAQTALKTQTKVSRHVINQNITESRQSIQGERRIEYIPYEKTIVEYEAVTRVEYIPKERKVVEYYPVEYQTQYVPQVIQQKVIEYVPVEKVHERVEYIPVERQIFYPPEEHIETNQSGETPVIRSSGLPQHIISSSSRPPISMSSRGLQGNISFQNSGILHQPPQDNSVYTKEPLPSSKRRYI